MTHVCDVVWTFHNLWAMWQISRPYDEAFNHQKDWILRQRRDLDESRGACMVILETLFTCFVEGRKERKRKESGIPGMSHGNGDHFSLIGSCLRKPRRLNQKCAAPKAVATACRAHTGQHTRLSVNQGIVQGFLIDALVTLLRHILNKLGLQAISSVDALDLKDWSGDCGIVCHIWL